MRTPTLPIVATTLFTFGLGLLNTIAADSRSPAGHWEGHIALPATQLSIQVDVEKQGADWKGTISIPVQGLRAFPLSDLQVTEATVHFTMRNIPGDPTFDGKLGANGKAITGDFYQSGSSFPFQVERAAKTEAKGATPAKGIPGEGFAGIWQGSPRVNVLELRLLVKLKETKGELTGTMDSLDQNANNIPISKATR